MLNFEKIILHNFGSYGHAEQELTNKGFCLVSGQNKFKKDNATSNGSGKSFLWNGICYALTGETLNGLHSNLKNIRTDYDPKGYVTLLFTYGKDRYELTRYFSPKSDLQIIQNDINISGKGIRESEKKLGEVLPNLTKDYIASTVLLGQGMPHKFSSFSPSGRKDLLEKLTRSDFMIEDVKERVETRHKTLEENIAQCSNIYLVTLNQINTYKKLISDLETEEQILLEANYDAEIKLIEDQITHIKKAADDVKIQIAECEKQLETINLEITNLTTTNSQQVVEAYTAYNEDTKSAFQEQSNLAALITAKQQEINKLKSIKDTCPTCGQKLPGQTKPDTSQQEKEVVELNEKLDTVKTQLTEKTNNYNKIKKSLDENYNSKLSIARQKEAILKQDLRKAKDDEADYSHCYNIEYEKLLKLKYSKENSNIRLEQIKNNLVSNRAFLVTEEQRNKEALKQKEELKLHLDTVKKMETLIRRDFRGYLLTNIIAYLDHAAKAFSEIVFGTRELNIYIDGNVLEITYDGKLFDNLSGGEKQKVDLILQFALRKLLNDYNQESANIIVLDEITDFLDKEGCDKILKLIEHELNTVESVFIVSHHANELNIPVDSEIKIIKNEDGISEIY